MSGSDAVRVAPNGMPGAVGAAVIDPGVVVDLSDPGVELTAPTDGRLRGDGIALVVTGAALADRAGRGSEAVSAGPGRHLIVFGFRQVPQANDPNSPPASLALVVAGDRRTVDLPSRAGQGPWYNAAAIPAGVTDVNLVLSGAGFDQRFSLITLTRPGPDPVALYRDVDNPAVVQKDSSAVGVAATTGPPDSSSYHLLIGAATTTVSWFAPDASLRTAPSPDKAFLSVQLDMKPTLDNNNYFGVLLKLPSAYPASHVHLVLGDGTRLDATHTGEDYTTFSGVYYFTVPADVAAATFSVDTYSAPGEIDVGGVAHGVITFNAFTIPLALSTAPATSAPTTPPTSLKVIGPSTGPTSSPSSHAAGSGLGGLALAVLAVSVAVLGVGALTVLGRRRRGTGTPAPGVYPTSGTTVWSTQPPLQPNGRSPAPPTAPTPPVTLPSSPLPAEIRPQMSPAKTVAQPAFAGPPTLTAIPGDPSEPPAGTLYFEVLGPFRITGWSADQIRSAPVIDLAAYLALHPGRAYTADELRDPLSMGKPRALEANTIRTYAGSLRRILGARHLPDAGRKGYALSDTVTDWQRFVELVKDLPDAMAPPQQAQRLAAALSLVRGMPFSELPSNGFAWVATELLVSQVEVAVIGAARRLAELALSAGDWPLAAWASQRGLYVSPTTEELNAGALRAALLSGQSSQVAQVWRDINRRYSAAAEVVPNELRQLHGDIQRESASRPRT